METDINIINEKMYNWEKQSIFPLIRISAPWALRKLTIEEARDFLNKVYEGKHIRPPKILYIKEKDAVPEIVLGKIRAKLLIPDDYMRPILLLHQCAILTSKSKTLDINFITEYIKLLDRYIGIKKDASLMALKLHGIDYNETL